MKIFFIVCILTLGLVLCFFVPTESNLNSTVDGKLREILSTKNLARREAPENVDGQSSPSLLEESTSSIVSPLNPASANF